MTAVEFEVYGRPAPQGSKKAYVRGNRAVLVESSAAVKPWREAVKYAARDAMWAVEPLSGPLWVDVTFYLDRPASEPKRRRTWPCRRPDADKLCRALFDAITDSGLWHDDAQVVDVHVRKDWALTRPPGAVVFVRDAADAAEAVA